MKTLIASVKFLALAIVVATVAGFFVMDHINIKNTWLDVKPVSNAAAIVNLVEMERMGNPEITETDEVSIASVQGLLPALGEEKLYDKTFYYVEGTYGAYCVVTFNNTDNPEKENMVIKSSDNFSHNIESHGGNCSEGIIDRAYENGWYVGPEGGVPVA